MYNILDLKRVFSTFQETVRSLLKLVNSGAQTNVTQTGLPPSSCCPANAKTSQPIHFSLPCHSCDIHLNPSNLTELSEPRRPDPPSPTSSQLNDWPDFPEIITHSTFQCLHDLVQLSVPFLVALQIHGALGTIYLISHLAKT